MTKQTRTIIQYEDIQPGDLIEILLTGRPDYSDLTHHAMTVNHTGLSSHDEPVKGIVFEEFGTKIHHSEYSVYTKITETSESPSNDAGGYFSKPAYMLRKGDKFKVRQTVSGVPFTTEEMTFSRKTETQVFVEESDAVFLIGSSFEFLVKIELPTKPGSVILIDLVDAESPAFDVNMWSSAIRVADGRWVTTNVFGNFVALKPANILRWRPATVVDSYPEA